MGNPKNVPFKFWCHKILPLVYDDSLSYYEFLCKVNEVVQGLADHDVEQDEAIEKNAGDILVNAENIAENTRQISSLSARVTALLLEVGKCTANICEDYDEEKVYLGGNLAVFSGDLYRCVATSTTGQFNVDDWEKTTLAKEVENLWYSMASVYLPAMTYNTGDIIEFNDTFYRCLEDDVTGEFDDSKWEAIVIGEVIEDLTNDVNTAMDVSGDAFRRVVDNEEDVEKLQKSIAGKYVSSESYDVDDYCIYEGELYKCVNSTTGSFDTNDWVKTNVTSEMSEGGSGNVDGVMDIIAHTFNENDGYVRGQVVKKKNANDEWVLYKCDDDYVTGTWDDTKWDEFYPTNVEISGMQLYDLVVPTKEQSIQNMTDISNLDTFFNSCVPMFLDKSVDATYPTQNFPKFSLCRKTGSPAPFKHVYYCTSDTDNTSFDSNVWVEITNLQEWISAQISSINMYSEVRNNTLNSSVT